MNMVSYSPDGQLIATGGDDGKVKLWNTSSGFCTVTFTEHVGGITGLVFAASGLAVLSASLDGTVRAYDLMRYRNFRTFTSPEPTQFSSLALDPSGELVCAGCVDTFEVCVWSMKTGKLLEMLSGHVGPVSGLVFNPIRALLASSSWDNTVRLWDVFDKKQTRDTLELGSDVVALAFRPDGRELVSSSLSGSITTWDVTSAAKQLMTIEGRKDIQGGRLVSDRRTAKHANASKCFTSVCYNADGTCLLAGGNTKYVCIYELAQGVLLKRFCISENRSMDGTLSMLNSKDMSEAGPMALINVDSDSDMEDRLDDYMPGTSKGDMSSRKSKPEVRTKAVQFSPTGRSWAAASTVGLLVYSLDDSMVFDPFDLDIDINPDTVRHAVAKREFAKALVMAFRLGEEDIEHEVFEAVPPEDVALVAQTIPAVYLLKIVTVLSVKLDKSPHLEYYLQWSRHLLNSHGQYLKNNISKFAAVLRSLHRSLTRQHGGIGTLCEENRYALLFLATAAKLTETTEAAEGIDDAVAPSLKRPAAEEAE
jgi:periodic tryptophan protein 2